MRFKLMIVCSVWMGLMSTVPYLYADEITEDSNELSSSSENDQGDNDSQTDSLADPKSDVPNFNWGNGP